MKLYWSSRSPYVRKVMFVAHEKGLAHRIERIPIVVSDRVADKDFHAVNPLGRIPTLILADGMSVYDSTVIADYLDSLSPDNPLMPVAPWDRLTVQCLHTLGTGIMDLLVPLRGEVLRPEHERSAPFIAAGEAKFQCIVDRLEPMIDEIASGTVNLGQIAIATALSYSDFRFSQSAWRNGRPRLTTWFDTIADRPAFRETAFA